MTPIHQRPVVNKITIKDITDALAGGLRDFRNAPLFGLFFAGLYVAAGWLLIALLNIFKMPFLAYPLAVGFAFVAPFATVGFYAVSRHFERGKMPSWERIFTEVHEAAQRDLRWMALVTGFALIVWMDLAAFLFFTFIGFNGFGPDIFEQLFTTQSGLMFFALGNIVGAAIAIMVFSISVISFPMLFERDIDFVTAMAVSVRVVKTNPVAMLLWCALIGLLMGLSMLTGLLGLLVVLPVTGHATWRLYRRAVAPASPEEAAASATA